MAALAVSPSPKVREKTRDPTKTATTRTPLKRARTVQWLFGVCTTNGVHVLLHRPCFVNCREDLTCDKLDRLCSSGGREIMNTSEWFSYQLKASSEGFVRAVLRRQKQKTDQVTTPFAPGHALAHCTHLWQRTVRAGEASGRRYSLFLPPTQTRAVLHVARPVRD